MRYSVHRTTRLRVLAASVLAFGIAVFPAISFAHTVGASYTQTVGAYVVDVGYNPPVEQVGTKFILDFKLWEAPAEISPVAFTDVWVTITQNGSTTVSTKIPREEYLATTLSYTPTTPEPITIRARYEREDTVLADVAFSLPVAPSGDDVAIPAAVIVFSMVLIFFVVLLAKKYSNFAA